MTLADHVSDVARYMVNAKAVAAIVKHLGVAMSDQDALLVASRDKQELARIRESFVKKRLGVALSDMEIDGEIQAVVTRMKADREKRRVTFYYLLAERLGKIDALR